MTLNVWKVPSALSAVLFVIIIVRIPGDVAYRHVAYVSVLKETRTPKTFDGIVPDGKPFESTAGFTLSVFASTPIAGKDGDHRRAVIERSTRTVVRVKQYPI